MTIYFSRFRRATDLPSKEGFFFLLNLNKDEFITREEWIREKGSDEDFDKLLKDLDKDGMFMTPVTLVGLMFIMTACSFTLAEPSSVNLPKKGAIWSHDMWFRS